MPMTPIYKRFHKLAIQETRIAPANGSDDLPDGE
jgi:hypothetical protein